MLVTRTETYTDWVFQTPHANEVAATVGRGLLKGHIYFRYAYDMLKEGDKVDREVSHVHLSDGSTYELGTGLSSEKITIVYHGLTSDGSVYISVDGHKGVGVSSVTRTLTITYDDGKVPVLDTEQLEDMFDDLNDSLKESMTNTANAVKDELREELKTTMIETKDEVDEKLVTHTTEMKSHIQTELQKVTTSLTEKITTGDSELRTLVSSSIQAASSSLTEAFGKGDEAYRTQIMHDVDSRIRIGRWTLGQFSVASGQYNNTLSAQPYSMTEGDDMFGYNATNQTLVLTGGISQKNRILRLVYTTLLNTPANYNGYLSFVIRNLGGGNLARNTHSILREKGFMENMDVYQFTIDLFIKANYPNHPIFSDGVRVAFGNNGNATAILKTGSTLDMMLFTAG